MSERKELRKNTLVSNTFRRGVVLQCLLTLLAYVVAVRNIIFMMSEKDQAAMG